VIDSLRYQKCADHQLAEPWATSAVRPARNWLLPDQRHSRTGEWVPINLNRSFHADGYARVSVSGVTYGGGVRRTRVFDRQRHWAPHPFWVRQPKAISWSSGRADPGRPHTPSLSKVSSTQFHQSCSGRRL